MCFQLGVRRPVARRRGSELTASDLAAMNDRIAQSAKRLPDVEPGAIRGGAGEATGLGYGTPEVRGPTVSAGRG